MRSKRKILVIEDDQAIRMNLAELLEENGYSVLSAATGSEGIRTARETVPDLIISDIMLPDIDGYEIISRINKTPGLSVIPFIFLTAKADMQDLRKGMLLGAADYITKPYDAAELIRVIELRLSRAEELRSHYQNNSGQDTAPLQQTDKIIVMVNGKPSFIKLSRVIYIAAENVYTNVFLKDARPVVVRKSMKEWEKILPANLFLRIHRGIIVNTDRILKIEKWFNRTYKLYLDNSGESFIISQRYAAKLKSRIV